jgi:prolyl oligopeptidase
MTWTKDSKGFFYSRFESPESLKQKEGDKAGTETEKLQYQKVYYHRVGSSQEEDVLIYEDSTQPDWMFDASVTNDGNYLLLSTRKNCDDIGLLAYADLTTPEVAALTGPITFTPLISEWIGGFQYV